LVEPKIINVELDDGSVTPAKLSADGPNWDAAGNTSVAGSLTASGPVVGTEFKTNTDKYVFRHAGAYTSATITYSTLDPSGGNDGDLWFKYV